VFILRKNLARMGFKMGMDEKAIEPSKISLLRTQAYSQVFDLLRVEENERGAILADFLRTNNKNSKNGEFDTPTSGARAQKE